MSTGHLVRLAGRGSMFVLDTAGAEGATAVFLLHGLGATAALNWPGAAMALSPRFRVLEVDHRGHGRGIRSARRFRLEDCADDLVALADVVGIERFVAAGYSMGGPIALFAARRHPDRVAGLALCATSARFTDEDAAPSSLVGVMAAGLRLTPPVLRRGMAASMLGYAGRRYELPPAVIEEMRRHDPAAIVEAAQAVGNFDATAWLGEVRCATASIITTRDRLVSPRRQLDLARRLGAVARYVHADHDAPVRQPGQFLPALVESCRSVALRAAQRPAG